MTAVRYPLAAAEPNELDIPPRPDRSAPAMPDAVERNLFALPSFWRGVQHTRQTLDGNPAPACRIEAALLGGAMVTELPDFQAWLGPRK